MSKKNGSTVRVLNFSHPLTAEQITAAENLIDQPIEQVINVPVHFSNDKSFEIQLRDLMAELPLSSEELQTTQVVVNPPAFNTIAVLVLADLHGRMGYFPPVLRVARVTDSLPPRFDVAEVINLQAVRDRARRDM